MVHTEPGPPTSRMPGAGADPADQRHTGGQDDPAAETGSGPSGLDARSAAVLAFERQWWARAGAKEEAIRRQFDLSPTAYYQLLSRLIDDPAAERAEPMLIRRLRQQRAARDRTADQGPTTGTEHPWGHRPAVDVQRPSARS